MSLVRSLAVTGSVHHCAADLLCGHVEGAHVCKMLVPDEVCAVNAHCGSQANWMHDPWVMLSPGYSIIDLTFLSMNKHFLFPTGVA